MAARKTPQPPSTSGYAWGPERVRLGLSLRQLAALSGVKAPYLSLIEQGKLAATPEQWKLVVDALRDAEAQEAGA